MKYYSVLVAAALLLGGCDRVQRLLTEHRAHAAQGGAYLVLEVDAGSLSQARLDALSEDMANAMRQASPAISYTGRGVRDDAARLQLLSAADADRAAAALGALQGVALTRGPNNVIEARLTPAAAQQLSASAATQSVAVLQRRYQSPDIMVEAIADQRILVHAGPRVTDPAELANAFSALGSLSFSLVREIPPSSLESGLLPPRSIVVPPYPGVGDRSEVVDRHPAIVGHIENAHASTNSSTGEYVLVFRLDAHGRRLFCHVTRDHIGQRFAILLDNQVLTAPVINEPICGGTGQISGNFTAQSASDLAIMLNAGALPAPLKVVQQGVGSYSAP